MNLITGETKNLRPKNPAAAGTALRSLASTPLLRAMSDYRSGAVSGSIRLLGQGVMPPAKPSPEYQRTFNENLAKILNGMIGPSEMERRLTQLGFKGKYARYPLKAISIDGGGIAVQKGRHGQLKVGQGVTKRVLRVFPELTPLTVMAGTATCYAGDSSTPCQLVNVSENTTFSVIQVTSFSGTTSADNHWTVTGAFTKPISPGSTILMWTQSPAGGTSPYVSTEEMNNLSSGGGDGTQKQLWFLYNTGAGETALSSQSWEETTTIDAIAVEISGAAPPGAEPYFYAGPINAGGTSANPSTGDLTEYVGALFSCAGVMVTGESFSDPSGGTKLATTPQLTLAYASALNLGDVNNISWTISASALWGIITQPLNINGNFPWDLSGVDPSWSITAATVTYVWKLPSIGGGSMTSFAARDPYGSAQTSGGPYTAGASGTITFPWSLAGRKWVLANAGNDNARPGLVTFTLTPGTGATTWTASLDNQSTGAMLGITYLVGPAGPPPPLCTPG